MEQSAQFILEPIRKRPLVALAVVLLIGLAVRLYLLPTAGMALDLVQHYHWGLCAVQNGWFGLYNCQPPVTHPPINPSFYGLEMWLLTVTGANVSYFDKNPIVIAALKSHMVLMELVLMSLLYYVVHKRAGAVWAIGVTAALYWSPGWLVVTAWWGQNDVAYTLFMLLTAYLLTQRKIRWAWVAFAVGWLAKFQSVMFLPVFGIISLRRYGLRATIEGGLLFALIVGGGTLPFLIGSGLSALNPYLGTIGLFPNITSGAHNMWFWISGSTFLVQPDSLKFIGSLSYAQTGLILLVIGTALLCLRAWFVEAPDDIYLLFAAANLIFFMLPTQIQPRYLYPGVMFLALAMVKNWRLVAFYVCVSIVFMYNIFGYVWLGVGILFYPYKLMNLVWSATANALAMTALFLVFMWMFFRPLAQRISVKSAPGQPS